MKDFARVIVALLVFIIFANFFFFHSVTPLSISLFWLGLCIYIITVAQHRHTSMLLMIVTGFYAVMTIWMRAAQFILIQSILFLIAATASLWYVSLSKDESFGSFTAVFLSPFFAGLTYVKRAFSLIKPTTISEIYRRGTFILGNRNTHSRSTSTLIGGVIAIPIMLILVSMFATADPIYYSYLKHIVSSNFFQELPMRIVISFVLLGAIIPLIFPKIRRIFVSPGQVLGRIRMTHELTIVMAVVAFVIASFIIIQWPYVFASVKAEIDLSQFGVATYAEYVTKGFVELLRVSAFIYALLWLGLTALRQETTKSRMLSVLQWVVMGEFMVILLSIARRVYLYQMYHGLTLIRVYGSFFLIWLVLMALTLAGRHLTHKVRFGYVEGILTICLFVVMGAWNVERFIVMTDPPTVNKRVDYVYLSRMSADGVDGWLGGYEHAKRVIEQYSNMTGEVDKDGRREIAYAEYIIRKMTYRQYDYMSTYASPGEMRGYINTIVDFQIKRLEKEWNDLGRYQLMRPNETWISNRFSEIAEIQKNLEKIKTQPLTDVTQTNESSSGFSDVVIDSWQNLQTFEPVSPPRLLSFYTSYNNIGPDNFKVAGNIADRYAKLTSLDRLYMQNKSDMRAFQTIKQHVPLAELHILQEKYYDLYVRIGKQAERDYEKDISLESPLL